MERAVFPKKVFAVGPRHNLILTNIDENTKFITPRIAQLKAEPFGSLAFYANLESIFTEFVDVCNFDKDSAVYPEPIGIFKDEADKKRWIENHLLTFDFDYHLGCILYNYHEWLVDSGQLPDVILSRMVVDYPSVYYRALYDYVSVLKGAPAQYPFLLGYHPLTNNAEKERESIRASLQREQLYGTFKPYFASFALPSLIERYMISTMQQDLVDKMMLDISDKRERGEIALSVEDSKLVNLFLSKPRYMDGSREDAMKKCHDIFDRAGLISDKATEQIVLGMRGTSPLTLGQFLQNAYVKVHIKKPYYDVLEVLFSASKVNLRNSIMHGNSITFDPYAMCFAAVMLQIFWAVIDKHLFC